MRTLFFVGWIHFGFFDFSILLVDEPSRGGAPTRIWMVLFFGLKLFFETFSNSGVPTLYLLSKHTQPCQNKKKKLCVSSSPR